MEVKKRLLLVKNLIFISVENKLDLYVAIEPEYLPEDMPEEFSSSFDIWFYLKEDGFLSTNDFMVFDSELEAIKELNKYKVLFKKIFGFKTKYFIFSC